MENFYKKDSEAYKEVMQKLNAELSIYYETIECLYNENKYDELKAISHSLRNIAGLLGHTKLKMFAAVWEEICDEKGRGDISEYQIVIGKLCNEILK